MSDEPLSPAEIAAWARDYLAAIHTVGGFPPGDLPASLVNAANKDYRVLRQIAETFERLVILTGGRHFATDSNGVVNLPVDHIRRSVANELAQQFAPMMRMSEKWDGYRLRVYTASMTVVLPEGEITDGRETENRNC